MKTALLFPGQGSQRVGMGRDLANVHEIAKRTYEEADSVLGFELSKLCFEGPENELTLTKHTQPAILTTSIAVFRVLIEKGLEFHVVAGHSLGEWTALVASGALQLSDAVRLTHLRGTYMQEAVPVGEGAMAAFIGLDLPATRALCERVSRPGDVVEIANINGGGQICVSGHTAAVDRAIAEAGPSATKLPVSAPFHCSLMKPAAQKLAEALADVHISKPSVPLIANVTAEPTSDPARIKELLVQQVTAPVRWEESIKHIASSGVVRAYELGSGAVLKKLVRRTARSIVVTTIGEPHEVAEFKA